MKTLPILESKRLLLRQIKKSDQTILISKLNNKSISENILNIPHPFTVEDAIKRMNFVWDGFKNKDRFVFAITIKGEGESICGEIGLHLDKGNHKAEIGYWVSETHWSKGIATEATKLIIQFGFEELNLNKIFATHFLKNQAYGKVLINNKMIKEAELVDHYYHQNKYMSVIQFRLTKDEYNLL